MTGMADAAPRSPEAWKSMGCCADFPQPWADLMWGLEFEDTHPLARVFRQAGASVCEHDCPVRAECCLCSMVLRPVERLVFSPKER